MNKRILPALITLSLVAAACSPHLLQRTGPPVAGLPQAHAHNDYQHERPLLDALAHGFTSIEADIHLRNQQLLVGHDPEEISPDRTLQSLYLDPLQDRIKRNQGAVFEKDTRCFLFIDIKTDADSTYAALDPVLQRYRKMLTEYRQHTRKQRAVTIILSGNRPITRIKNQSKRWAAIDGRLDEQSFHESAELMPIVSDKWENHFSWRGQGLMPGSEQARLTGLIRLAHASGHLIRFWGTDVDSSRYQTDFWSLLHQAGVDLINTDKLEELQTFLLQRQDKRSP